MSVVAPIVWTIFVIVFIASCIFIPYYVARNFMDGEDNDDDEIYPPNHPNSSIY